jgi:hypothetical protein
VSIEKTMTVLLVHGEGDRATVNALQAHRNAIEISNFARANPGKPLPQHLVVEPDEPPDVTVLLTDPAHPGRRIEWPLANWQEVEAWKELAGFDGVKRHWQTGATVLLTPSQP